MSIPCNETPHCSRCTATENLTVQVVNGDGILLCAICGKRFEEELSQFQREYTSNEKMASGIALLLEGLHDEYGLDLSNTDLIETPNRVARMYTELCGGYATKDPKVHFATKYPTEKQQLIKVQDINFVSLCIHHLAIITGTVHIGYVPGKYWAGLSKFGRVVDAFARRLQLQEKMTDQIIDAIMEGLEPLGAIVVVRGQHDCMSKRGSRKADSITTTDAVRGIFLSNDKGVKDEFLALLAIDSGIA